MAERPEMFIAIEEHLEGSDTTAGPFNSEELLSYLQTWSNNDEDRKLIRVFRLEAKQIGYFNKGYLNPTKQKGGD